MTASWPPLFKNQNKNKKQSMKTEKQINPEKLSAPGQSLTLAAVALAGLALAAGCSSEREARVSYHSPRSETYAEARVTTDTRPAEPGIVVTPDRPDAAGAAE